MVNTCARLTRVGPWSIYRVIVSPLSPTRSVSGSYHFPGRPICVPPLGLLPTQAGYHCPMFQVETITTPGLAQNSYLLLSKGEAFIIDPRRDIEVYLARLQDAGLTLKGVAETHSHADFVAGSRALAEATRAPLYSGSMRPESAHVQLEHGHVLLVGDAEVVCLHTPGHTPNHFAYFVTDRHDPQQPPAFFSGDVMFVGDLGRPELLGADLGPILANQLYDTVWGQIHELPGHTILYPGHGAGSACGKNLSSKPTSTLADEFASSPALQLTREAFISYMLADQPRVPVHFSEMVALNQEGQAAPTPFAAIPQLTADEILSALSDPAIRVIDARSVAAFSEGHIPGTTSLGVNPGVPTWMGWLLDGQQQVVAIVESVEQAEELRRWMVRVGFDKLDGYYVFKTADWQGRLQPLQTVPGAGFDAAGVDGALIDVRTPSEYARGTLPNAKSIPLCEIPKRWNELDPKQPVTLFCGSGYRSTIASSILLQHGFQAITNVSGGVAEITKASPACVVTAG